MVNLCFYGLDHDLASHIDDESYIYLQCCCGMDGELIDCVNGKIYGPCTSVNCDGVCEYVGNCTCFCHQSEGKTCLQSGNTSQRGSCGLQNTAMPI